MNRDGMSRGARLLTLVLAQTAVLAALIGFRQWTLDTGTPVVLAIRPVDPRSLFQGDYVELTYEIGHLRLDRLAGDDDLERGETVFVDLQPGRPAWQAAGGWRQRPGGGPGGAGRRGRRLGSGDSVRWRRRREPSCAGGSNGWRSSSARKRGPVNRPPSCP